MVVVGHVAVDVNVMPWGIVENALGGAPTYAGLALLALGKGVGVVSKVGFDFTEMFPPIYSKLGLDTQGMFVKGEHTTTFRNVYDKTGNREQVCKHVAAGITPDDVPEDYKGARGFYISPLADEVAVDVLREVKWKENTVMMDPQGLFRRVNVDGRIAVHPRDDLQDFLKYVDVVKIGKDEAKVFQSPVKEVLTSLTRMGPKIAIMTLGESGCAIVSDGRFLEVGALKVDVKDMTGAGDVFGAAFLAKFMETSDVLSSAKFASAAAGLKVRYKGPTGFPSEGEVMEALSRHRL